MTSVSLSVPDDLREFFAYVRDLIAMEDDSATQCSGDLIQEESACAGLIDPDRELFIISYFGTGGRWELRLTATQIEMAAEGHISTVPLFRCETCGRCFPDRKHQC